MHTIKSNPEIVMLQNPVVEQCPVWERIRQKFPAADPARTAVAYAPFLYFAGQVSPDLEAHELVHIRQQEAMGVEKWWENYLANPVFVKSQEAEAYERQGEFVRAAVRDRNARARILWRLRADMTGDLYNRAFTDREAKAILGG